MKRCIVFLALACFVLTASLAPAAVDSADKGQFTVESHRSKATVASIDLAAMKATLTLEDGKAVEVALDPKVKNLDRVHVGDTVVVNRMVSLLLYPMTAGNDADSYTLKDVRYKTTPEGLPVKYLLETHVSTPSVKAYDKKARTITLEGEDGKTVVYTLGRTVKGFAQVKPGDRIYARYTESVKVKVKPGKAQK